MQELLQVWAQFLLENSVSAQGVDSGCSVMSPFRDPVELCFSLFCAAHGGDVSWPCPPRGRSNNAECCLGQDCRRVVVTLVLRVWSFLYLVFSEAAGTTAGMPWALDAPRNAPSVLLLLHLFLVL